MKNYLGPDTIHCGAPQDLTSTIFVQWDLLLKRPSDVITIPITSSVINFCIKYCGPHSKKLY